MRILVILRTLCAYWSKHVHVTPSGGPGEDTPSFDALGQAGRESNAHAVANAEPLDPGRNGTAAHARAVEPFLLVLLQFHIYFNNCILVLLVIYVYIF